MYHQFRLKAGEETQASIAGRYILVDSTGAADGVTITPMKGGSAIRELPDRQKAFKCQVEFDTIVLKAPVDCTVALFLSMTDVSLGFTDTSMLKVSGEVRVTNDGDNPVAVDLGANAAVMIANDPENRVPVDLGGGPVVIANGPDRRVPVDIGGGTVEVTATNVGINNDDDNPVPIKQKPGEIFDVEVRNEVRSRLASRVADLEPVAVNDVRVKLADVDAERRGLRIKNAGAVAVAIGGAAVAFASAVIVLQPGEVWNETEAPGAAWHAITDAGAASNIYMQAIE